MAQTWRGELDDQMVGVCLPSQQGVSSESKGRITGQDLATPNVPTCEVVR